MNKQIKNWLIILLVVVFDRIIYWQKNWHIKLLQGLGERLDISSGELQN